MTPIYQLARNDISPSVRRYAAEMKLGGREAVKQTARGINRRVIDITPPGSEGSVGRDARSAGEGKIAQQMEALFAPKRLKGRRRITTVFGHRLKRPVFVPTREKYPDVAGIYRANMRVAGTGVGMRLGRVRRKYYVDVRKFDALLKAKQAKVGTLAAGWLAAAQALDVPVQQWISRHGSSGGLVTIDVAGDRMRVVVENLGAGLPPNLRAELARRIPYAVQYQANAMERAIAGRHERLKRSLGIKSAA